MRRGPYTHHRWSKALEKADRAAARKQKPKQSKRREIVLLATTIQEYKKLQQEYPQMKITLDTSGQEQGQLFNTRGLGSNE